MDATDNPTAAWAALGTSVVALTRLAEILLDGTHWTIRLGIVLALTALTAKLFWPLGTERTRHGPGTEDRADPTSTRPTPEGHERSRRGRRPRP